MFALTLFSFSVVLCTRVPARAPGHEELLEEAIEMVATFCERVRACVCHGQEGMSRLRGSARGRMSQECVCVCACLCVQGATSGSSPVLSALPSQSFEVTPARTTLRHAHIGEADARTCLGGMFVCPGASPRC